MLGQITLNGLARPGHVCGDSTFNHLRSPRPRRLRQRGGGCAVFLGVEATSWTVLLTLAICATALTPANAQRITLQTATGGFTVSGSRPNFRAGFGNVNGLGVGTLGTGISLITSGVSGGVLYITNYNMTVAGTSAQSMAVVSAYVSSNFSHPAVLVVQSCYPAATCTSASSFTTLSNSSGSPTTIIPVPGVSNGTYTASLALFVTNINGSGAFSGTDTATVTFRVYGYSSNTKVLTWKEDDTLTLNTPFETVQTAVQLLLATASGGLTISAGSNFSTNYGTVNGLGIFPPGGLTVVSVAGGVVYTTPYLLTPSFSSFSSSTGTITAYVSADFAHPAILTLRDATAVGGPYTGISKASGSPTVFTAGALSTVAITRYLGLYVSNLNGSSAFTGSDTATLTYTLTVP
jgi:hypothetical protein